MGHHVRQRKQTQLATVVAQVPREGAVRARVRRLAVQDGVAAGHVDAVLHDGLDVGLVADVHEARGREAVLCEDLEEDFVGGLVLGFCDGGYALAGV